MSYKECASIVVDTLIKLVCLGRNRGNVSDLEMLVDALRVLRPNLIQLDVFDAWLCMRRNRWKEALHLLRQVENRSSYFPLCTALMGCCFYNIRDPIWHIYTAEALQQKEDIEAKRIAVKVVQHAVEKEAKEQAWLDSVGRAQHQQHYQANAPHAYQFA